MTERTKNAHITHTGAIAQTAHLLSKHRDKRQWHLFEENAGH